MNTATPSIPAVTAANFETEVIEASHHRLVLVDFWAQWCGPCKALAPILQEAQQARAETVQIVKVDVDAESRLAGLHGVRAMPTMAFFRNRQKVDQLVGLQSLDAVLARIDANAGA